MYVCTCKVHVRACGVLTTEHMKVESAEERKSRVGLRTFLGTF